jgi:hypothetical protein
MTMLPYIYWSLFVRCVVHNQPKDKFMHSSNHIDHMTECGLFTRERPAVLQSLPLPLILKYHTNTVGITSFLEHILHTLQEKHGGPLTLILLMCRIG